MVDSVIEFETQLPLVRNCSACHVPYLKTKPVLLACGHTICEGCHRRLEDEENALPSRALQGESTEDEIPMPASSSCPTCGANKGIEMTYSHPGLEEVLASSPPRRKAEDDLKCVKCSNSFELYCTTCKVSMCLLCDQEVHQVAWFAGHKRLPYVEQPCPRHTEEKLELVCTHEGCSNKGALICFHCTRRGQLHGEHAYEWAKDRARINRVLLREKRQQLWTLLLFVNRAICHLSNLSQEVRMSKQFAVKGVDEEMNKLQQHIGQREAGLITALTVIADIKASQLRAQAEKISESTIPSYLLREQAETIPDKPHFYLLSHADTLIAQLTACLDSLGIIDREPCLSPGFALNFPTLPQIVTDVQTAGHHLQVPPSTSQDYPILIPETSSVASSSS